MGQPYVRPAHQDLSQGCPASDGILDVFLQITVARLDFALGVFSLSPSFQVLIADHFAGDFLDAMGGVQDFWQEPAYAQLLQAMQKRVHDYVVADQGTAQEALDALVKDWTEVFEDEGKLN